VRGRGVVDMRRGRPPWPVILMAGAGAALLVLPLVGLAQRAPWSGLPSLLAEPATRDAIRLSLISASLATLLGLLLGVPLAWVLSQDGSTDPTSSGIRRKLAGSGHSVLRALVTLPMVLPPVVGGTALLFALGRRGLVGQPLDEQLGIVLPYSLAGVVVAQTFVAMPFLVLTVEGALRTLDTRKVEAAATLGARPGTTFRRVTVPSIVPSLVAGVVLCWSRALGEFGATLTFAGNLPGRTQTIPLAVYLALEGDRESALALSLVQVALALGVLLALRRRWWPTSSRPNPAAVTPRSPDPGPKVVPEYLDLEDGRERLQADVVVRLDEFELDVGVEAEPGEVLAVVGPNGAGKTTLLRALAGLVPLTSGRVSLGGTVFDDPAAGVHLPTHRRPIGFVFQELALFEHLDVLDNVAFGLRCRGVDKLEARRRSLDWLERLGLAGQARTRPSRLSRGQAQRVALARALVTGPSLLLLDEPLAAVDLEAKDAVRYELRRHLASADGVRLLVTHDRADAELLADRIITLDQGHILTDTPAPIPRQ
jgi:NifC-like ABC-type porter